MNKTKIIAPALTRRKMLLETNGPGPRPCVDGAANWLGCTNCQQSCMLAAGHQLDQDRIAERLAAIKAARAEKARHARCFVPRGRMLRKAAGQ